MKSKTPTTRHRGSKVSLRHTKFAICLPLFVLALNVSCASTQIPASLDQQVRKNIDVVRLQLDEELVTYFLEVAFGSEYSGGDGLVTWNQPIRIKLMGNYTKSDSLTSVAVTKELNNILSSTQFTLVQQNQNISMYFTDRDGFKKDAPKYAWNNSGYFSIRWTPKEKHVTGGKILVNTRQSQERRNHVIREEITQILGLMNDSERHPESIFYQNFSKTSEYAEIDTRVLRLWDALSPLSGYKRKEVARYLRKLI